MRVLSLVLLAACSKSPDIDVEHCWEYKLPTGWKAQPQHTPAADLLLVGPERFPVGTVAMSPFVSVKYVPGDLSLDDYRELLETATKHDDIMKQSVEQENAPGSTHPVGFQEVGKPVFSSIKIDGYDGFRVDLTSTLTVGGVPMPRMNNTLAVKVGRTIIAITGGYPTARKAEDQPASDAILASVHFAKCAAK